MISLLLALTIAMPQDTATVQVRVPPPIVQIAGDSVYVQVDVYTDSLAAVLQSNLEAAIAASGPVETSGSRRSFWEGAAVMAIGIGIGYLIWGREDDDDEDHDHDVNVVVETPPHEHPLTCPQCGYCWPPGHCKKGGGE